MNPNLKSALMIVLAFIIILVVGLWLKDKLPEAFYPPQMGAPTSTPLK